MYISQKILFAEDKPNEVYLEGVQKNVAHGIYKKCSQATCELLFSHCSLGSRLGWNWNSELEGQKFVNCAIKPPTPFWGILSNRDVLIHICCFFPSIAPHFRLLLAFDFRNFGSIKHLCSTLVEIVHLIFLDMTRACTANYNDCLTRNSASKCEKYMKDCSEGCIAPVDDNEKCSTALESLVQELGNRSKCYISRAGVSQLNGPASQGR